MSKVSSTDRLEQDHTEEARVTCEEMRRVEACLYILFKAVRTKRAVSVREPRAEASDQAESGHIDYQHHINGSF